MVLPLMFFFHRKHKPTLSQQRIEGRLDFTDTSSVAAQGLGLFGLGAYQLCGSGECWDNSSKCWHPNTKSENVLAKDPQRFVLQHQWINQMNCIVALFYLFFVFVFGFLIPGNDSFWWLAGQVSIKHSDQTGFVWSLAFRSAMGELKNYCKGFHQWKDDCLHLDLPGW